MIPSFVYDYPNVLADKCIAVSGNLEIGLTFQKEGFSNVIVGLI